MNTRQLIRMLWTLLLPVFHTIALHASERPKLIKGDCIQIVGAQPVAGSQGLAYIDFGTTREHYDTDLGDYEKKEYSFTLRRPHGANANYAASVWYQKASVEGFDIDVPVIHTDDFYNGESCPDVYQRDGWNCVVFQPGETEKVVTFTTKGYFSTNEEYARDLCAYIRFCHSNRVTLECDLLQLRFQNTNPLKPSATLADDEQIAWRSLGFIRNGYHPKAGEWLIAHVEMVGKNHWWTNGLPQLRIGNDTHMVMHSGYGNVQVCPTQPVSAEVGRCVDFAYRVTDADITALVLGEGTGILGFTSIKGLHVTGSSNIRDFTSDTPNNLYIDTDQHGILRPRFGQMTTDKQTYAPCALVRVSVEIANWQQLNAVYGADWQECISLTADGGKSVLNTQKGTFDATTGKLTFTFNAASPAPGQTQCTAYVEMMLTGLLLPTNDETDWPSALRLPYLLPAGAFFSYDVEGEPVIVYTESINIKGMPEGNAIRLTGKLQQLRVCADIQPADCSFLSGTWSSSNPEVATVSADGTIVLHRSGFSDISFRSSEADYRNAQGMASADGILVRSVRLHIQEYLPDDGEAQKYFTSDDEEVLITATLDRAHKIPGSQNEWLEAWEVDADHAEVIITHQESDKYPNIRLTVPIENQYYASVTIPFNDKTFLRKRYYDPETHAGLPTCTAVFSVPMRNKYDGETHTYRFTYDVYHKLTNAAFATNLSDSGAVVLKDDGSGHATMRMKNLDREEGFELSFFHGVLSDDGTHIDAMAHGAKYVEKKIKPGDVDIFEGEKDLGDGVVLRMQRDRKYVEATINYAFTLQKGETNALSAHVQNAYGMYDPRKPNWNAGENQQWMKEDPSAEWGMIEPYTQFSNRLKGTSFSGIGELGDEMWIEDNQEVYDAFVADPSDKNYAKFSGSNLIYFHVPNLYALWGPCEVIAEGKEVLKVIDTGGKGSFYLRFPFDDTPHTITFSWPKVGLKKDFSYTAYGRALLSRYRFCSVYYGNNSYGIGNLDVTYTTSMGESKAITVSPTKTDLYNRHYFTIDEPQGIVAASFTDHAGEGEEHAVLTPTIIDAPTPMLAAVQGASVLLFENETDATAQTQSAANLNVASLHTMDYIYLKVVDGVTGEPIPTACLKTSDAVHGLESGEALIKAWGRDLEGAIVYSTDGSYFPRIFSEYKLLRRSIVINGEEAFFDGERVVHTIALTPRTAIDGDAYVESIYLEETAPTGEGTQLVKKQYAGTTTLLPYDGSKKPGRKIRMRLMVRDLQRVDKWYDKLSLVSGRAAAGKSILLKRTAAGRKYAYHADALENGLSVSYSLIQVEGEMRDFLNPEVSGEVSLHIDGRQDCALFQMKNTDKDPSFMIDKVDFSPELPQINVGDVSRGKGLGKMQKSFDGFSIELPSSLPFTLGITHENNDYIVRGIYSRSFLPGGKILDLLDKGDYINNFDAAFWELKRAVKGRKAQYNRDERMLTLPSASAGIKAWIEGKVGFDYETERYNFVLNSVGIAAEASAYLKAKIPFGFGSFGTSIAGSASAQASIDHPSDEDLEALKGSPILSPFKMNLTFDFNTALSVGAYAELGIDLWVAAAKAGIRGSASAAFESMAVIKPYLGKVDKGLKMNLEAWLQAYATAKFLFFKKTWTGTILDKKGEWYVPNNSSNPIKQRDNDEDETRSVRTVLRSSVYKPLKLRRVPQNSNVLLTGIDAYAQPSYLFGGRDLAYLRPKSGEVTRGEVTLHSGMTFTAPSDHNVFAIHAASNGSDEKQISAIAYTYSTDSSPLSADAKDVARAAANARVAVSMSNGNTWSKPATLSDSYCSIDPKTAISPTGNTLVAWKQGDFVQQNINGDPTAGVIDGSLMTRVYQHGKWQDKVALIPMDSTFQLTDYAVAIRDSVPMVFGTIARRDANGSVRSILATATLDKEHTAQTTVSDIAASQPYLVGMKSGYFGSVLVANEMGQTDVKLYRITEAGTLSDMGLLGLNNRGVVDYKLIAPKSADGIDGLAVVWKEIKEVCDEATGEPLNVRTSVYAARIARSTDGYIYLSCPQKLIDQPDDLIITYYDATFTGNELTAAITVADFDTDGANVLQSTVEFTNSIRCVHADLADRIKEGEEVMFRFQVFNEGYEAIDYLQINIDGRNTTRQVNLLPGHSIEVTAPAPEKTNLNTELTFNIIPYFSSAPMRMRTFAKALQRVRGQKQESSNMEMGTIKVQVADFAVKELSIVPDGKYAMAVTATVDNKSPLPMDAAWNVKVGLYKDAMGKTLYPGTKVNTVTQSQLYGQNGNNTATVGFHVTGIEKPTTLYLVAHTIDREGNVVEDQNPSDNVAAVNLFATKMPVGMDAPTVSGTGASFTVTNQVQGLLVKGVTEGRTIRVFNAVGQLIHWHDIPPGISSYLVPLDAYGTYLVTDGRHTEKAVHTK